MLGMESHQISKDWTRTLRRYSIAEPGLPCLRATIYMFPNGFGGYSEVLLLA